MNILLLGATGKTGLELVNQALEAGHKVKAIVRTPSKITTANPNLTVVSGDVTDAQTIASSLIDNDILISVLGNNKGSLITDSSKAIIAAADTARVKRVIVLSSFAVETERLQDFAKFITGMLLKNMIADKTAGETLLRASDLDWTIVYATALTNGTKEPAAHVIQDDQKLGLKNKISRSSVASWILKEATAANYVRQNVTISQQ